jgi:hypothetical protein
MIGGLMADTGVWVAAELDDEGTLRVSVSAAAEWREGETCTFGEDVQDQLPPEYRERITAALQAIIDAVGPQAMRNAKDVAMQHAAAVSGRAQPGVRTLSFEGSLGAEGNSVA